MKRTERALDVRPMNFEEVYGRLQRGGLSQAEAAEIVGISEPTFPRWRGCRETERAAGLYDRRFGRVSARRAPQDEVMQVLELFDAHASDYEVKLLHETLVSEHGFGTLQKRGPQELRVAGITTMAAANRFLREVDLPRHKAAFAHRAEEAGSEFVPFAGSLDYTLRVHEERVVCNDNTVRYRNLNLQIPADRHRHHDVKATVRVHEYTDGGLAVFHGPRKLADYDADGTPAGVLDWDAG